MNGLITFKLFFSSSLFSDVWRRNLAPVLDGLVQMIQEEESVSYITLFFTFLCYRVCFSLVIWRKCLFLCKYTFKLLAVLQSVLLRSSLAIRPFGLLQWQWLIDDPAKLLWGGCTARMLHSLCITGFLCVSMS